MFSDNIIVIAFINCMIFGVICTNDLHQNCTKADECVPISSCQPDQDRHPYLKSFQCGGNETDVLVCCDYYQNNIDLPDKDNCGDVSMSPKISSGDDAELDDFPWMALLKYENTEYGCLHKLGFCVSCAGSLINQRYILTAAHCLVGRLIDNMGELTHVKLGEFHIHNVSDCIENYCADPILTIRIEYTIPHPNYGEERQSNDIGLIRLSENVKYTFFVKPICLPSTVGMVPSDVGEFLQVAGWGKTHLSRYSAIKQKVRVPVYNRTLCGRRISKQLSEGVLCAGGDNTQDSCTGDSGGPLMKLNNNVTVYAIEGIVSSGPECQQGSSFVGIYTRVTSYESWIKRNILP